MKNPEVKKEKRSQKDYNMGFKLGVVSRVESGEMTYKQAQRAYGIQGRSTVLTWLRKHGTLDWTKPIVHSMKNPKLKETPAQQIKRLEKELADEKLKNSIMNSMVDVFDKQYGAGLRKKFSPEQSSKNNKKQE
jgi:transposase